MLGLNPKKQAIQYVLLFTVALLLSSSLLPNSVAGQSMPNGMATSLRTTIDDLNPSLVSYPAAAPPTLGAATWISCTPMGVATYAGRIHVRCAAAVGGISFFALSTVDASHAARTLTVLSAAHVAGRTVSILYDPDDTSGSAIGCQVDNCRLILAVEML